MPTTATGNATSAMNMASRHRLRLIIHASAISGTFAQIRIAQSRSVLAQSFMAASTTSQVPRLRAGWGHPEAVLSSLRVLPSCNEAGLISERPLVASRRPFHLFSTIRGLPCLAEVAPVIQLG